MMAEKNRLNGFKTIARMTDRTLTNNLSADPNEFSLRYYFTLAKISKRAIEIVFWASEPLVHHENGRAREVNFRKISDCKLFLKSGSLKGSPNGASLLFDCSFLSIKPRAGLNDQYFTERKLPVTWFSLYMFKAHTSEHIMIKSLCSASSTLITENLFTTEVKPCQLQITSCGFRSCN